MSDRDDWEQATATPVEGVRILGAEEAQAAIGGKRDDDALDLEAEHHSENGDEPVADEPTGEVPPLPHWTEPPTGAVPALFADERDNVDDDLDAWATISGSQPRFRAEESDWAEADFSEDLSGEESTLGALSEDGPVDEEAEFAEALAARRRPPRQPRQKKQVPPRPPAREAELAPAGPTAARDLPTALLTAAAVAVIAIICFTRGTTATAWLACIIVAVAALEFSNALRSKGLRLAAPAMLVGSALLPIAAKHYGVGAYPIFFALMVVVALLWFLMEITPGRPLIGVATTIMAFAYIGGLGGFSGLALSFHNGIGLILGVVICTVGYDVFGFFVGSQWGRTRIAPRISPNKSVEGTLAGMIASIVLGFAIAGAISPWTHKSGLALGFLCAFGAFFGDLAESMIKRDLGIKDFGALLPGHGGVMDRFDSLLFCLPIVYYLALTLNVK